MFFAHVVINAHVAALKQRPKRFNAVCVAIADNVLLGLMPDAVVNESQAMQSTVADIFIRINKRALGDILSDVWNQDFARDFVGNINLNLTAALQNSDSCCFCIGLDGLPMRLARQHFWHLTTLRFPCVMAHVNPNLVTDAKLALVVAEQQPRKDAKGARVEANWQEFLTNVKGRCTPPEKTTKIHENVWLIPLATGLPFLAELIQWGNAYSVPIRILFLAESPDWIEYPPTDKATSEA